MGWNFSFLAQNPYGHTPAKNEKTEKKDFIFTIFDISESGDKKKLLNLPINAAEVIISQKIITVIYDNTYKAMQEYVDELM